MERRGRPKKVENPINTMEKFHVDYVDDEGVIARWFFDRKRNLHGPTAVEAIYPEGHELFEGQNAFIEKPAKVGKVAKKASKIGKAAKPLPKSARRYTNPANGKEVGYTRAKMLGLI